jgi:hypothetical protein
MPSTVATPSCRDRAIAVRATGTKLGPGLMAPRSGAPGIANGANVVSVSFFPV